MIRLLSIVAWGERRLIALVVAQVATVVGESCRLVAWSLLSRRRIERLLPWISLEFWHPLSVLSMVSPRRNTNGRLVPSFNRESASVEKLTDLVLKYPSPFLEVYR